MFRPIDGATLTGTVTLENCNDPAQNLTFEFRPQPSGTPVVLKHVLTPTGTNTGTFKLEGIPDGTRLGREESAWLQRGVLGAADERRVARARRFTVVAAELGVAPAPLAIAWCLRNPHVSSVILGASRVGQLLQNLTALDVGQAMSEADWQRVEAAVA